MASPESSSRSATASRLLAASTPRAIRDALVEPERAEFERRYAEEMRAAGDSLDLTRVLAVIDQFRRLAEITQRHGAAAHTRMLAQAAALESGDDVVTISGAVHRAEINTKLGI
jgi:hypothetical protein